jgi:hypothetical protein
VAHDVPVLSDPYVANYFHFSLELVPRLRFLAGGFHAGVVMPGSCLQRPFQQDLLARTIGGRHCILLPTPLRIRDPILAHDTLCCEGVSWLRRASGIGASPGGRRIYIRRSGRGTRSAEGGGISEPPGFTALLRDFCFETIEFGNGDLGVAAQVALLDGAGLILAAHGAALTNLAYLGPEVSVLEVIGIGAPRACFMQIAATIGCRYHGFYSPIVDSQRNIVMDLDELRDAFHDRMPRPLAQA